MSSIDTLTTQQSTGFDPSGVAERPSIDTARFWVGTALAVGITALVTLVALIISTELLHIPVLVHEHGRLVTVGFGAYVLLAATAALAASVIYTLIVHFAPRPRLYYTWLAVLGTLLATLIPLTFGATMIDQLSLSVINLVVGLVITGLVPAAAVTARTGAPRPAR